MTTDFNEVRAFSYWYISQVYKTLAQTIPDEAKDESVIEVQTYFRSMLSQVDSSSRPRMGSHAQSRSN